MKLALILLVIVALVKTDDEDALAPGFRVKFGVGDSIGTSYFYDMPLNVTQAIADGMVEATPPTLSVGPLSQLTMYCMQYCYLCILFDDTDYVAGAQIGIRESQMTNAVFDYTVQGLTNWTVEIDGTNTSLWVIHLYFISTEQLEISKETRIRGRNPNKTLQYGGMWVTSFYGDLLFIPEAATDITEDTAFTKQACYAGMGLHYFYNMTEDTLCEDDTIMPWFTLVNSDELVGVGFLTSGRLNITTGATNVFESPTAAVLETIAPYAPDCLYNMTDVDGFTTMHIYVVDQPWNITCISDGS